MTGKTKIQWTQQSWNPFAGCSVTSPGCKNCYAMRQSWRVTKMQPDSHHSGLTEEVNGKRVWTGKIHSTPDKTWNVPLRRQKPTLYFVNSMGDVFHPNVPGSWIDRLFAIMALSPQHTFQILTKYPERMRDYCIRPRSKCLIEKTASEFKYWGPDGKSEWSDRVFRALQFSVVDPLPNVWLGVSVEDQKRADERIPILLDTPAAVRFISAEPLLGPVDLNAIKDPDQSDTEPGNTKRINALALTPPNNGSAASGLSARESKMDWIIVGGESGHGARRCDGEWISDIVSQCISAQVPVFVKQLGANFIDEAHGVAGAAVKLPDDCPPVTRLTEQKGGDWDEWPAHYRVRRMPRGVTL